MRRVWKGPITADEVIAVIDESVDDDSIGWVEQGKITAALILARFNLTRKEK